MSNYENISIEKKDFGITILKVNRPKALNALNRDTLNELRAALIEISKDETIRVLIFTGEGEKAFIAGADIAEMSTLNPSEGVAFSQLGHDVAKHLEFMHVPVIAAVNGFALGGGTEMAIACDFILASEKAVFGQPEVGLGIIPGFGGCFRLARYVGFPRAKELIFTGRKFKADEAKAMGLCLEVYPAEGFMEKVLEVAKSISQQSRSAVVKAKGLMVEFSENIGIHGKIDGESHAFGRLIGSPDQKEGMGAFVEKRKPLFKGL